MQTSSTVGKDAVRGFVAVGTDVAVHVQLSDDEIVRSVTQVLEPQS